MEVWVEEVGGGSAVDKRWKGVFRVFVSAVTIEHTIRACGFMAYIKDHSLESRVRTQLVCIALLCVSLHSLL